MHNMQDSSENYLEAIYILRKKHGHVRSVDVANYLDLSRPSVSKAVKKMEEGGLLLMEDDGELVLTPEGYEIGESIAERHYVVKEILLYLGVSEEVAEEDACKIEHALSNESFRRIKKVVDEL